MRVFARQYADKVRALVLVDGMHERQNREYATLSPTFWEDTQAVMRDAVTRVGGGAPAELEGSWDIMERGTLPEAHPLPDVPMTVITALRPDPTWVGGTKAGLEIWRRLHGEYFAYTTEGQHIVTSRSGHAVHQDQPELVIEAIRHLVRASR